MNPPRMLVLGAVLALVAGACGGCLSKGSTDVPGSGEDRGADAGSEAEASVVAEGDAVSGAADANPPEEVSPASAPATGPVIGTPLATFDSDGNGFTMNTFSEPGYNLANAATPATLTWTSADGSPQPGCLKITAPYSASGQWVDVERLVSPPADWSGKTLHVRMKLDPASTFSGYARLYVKTGAAYLFYPMTYPLYPQNAGWQEFVLPLGSAASVPPDASAAPDFTRVMAYGVDPMTTGGSPTPVTFYVDSFSIE